MRPEASEYGAYFANYVALADTDDIIERLKNQCQELVQFYYQLPQDKIDYAYGPDKWTIRELLGHMVDTERVFSYRAVCIVRGEQLELPGFEQDDYATAGRFSERPLVDLVEEFKYLRMANLHLYKSFTAEDMIRTGKASGYPASVRALLYMSAGHVQHHFNIMRDRYL